MEYMVFAIYLVVVFQFLKEKGDKKHGIPRGYRFYRTSGIINLLMGYAGLLCVNIFLPNVVVKPLALAMGI